jgi:hypothetical protein
VSTGPLKFNDLNDLMMISDDDKIRGYDGDWKHLNMNVT